jgi:hypothetical protein
MPTIYHSSDDEDFKIGPPLEVLLADKVMEIITTERESNNKNLHDMMEKIMTAERESNNKNLHDMMEKIMTAERERADKKFAGWKIAFDLMTLVFFMMTIVLVVFGYVVYTMPCRGTN